MSTRYVEHSYTIFPFLQLSHTTVTEKTRKESIRKNHEKVSLFSRKISLFTNLKNLLKNVFESS